MANDFDDFISAIQLSTFEDLDKSELKDPVFRSSIATNAYSALITTVEFGDILATKFLLEFPEIEAIITINENEALVMAASYGHIGVMNLLLKNENVSKMITANDNAALKGAREFRQDATTARLLEIPAVKAYELQHRTEDNSGNRLKRRNSFNL